MHKLGDGDPMGVPPGVQHGGTIGSYRLLGRLGAGGMGQVYLARSDRGRTVAVKLVREELAAQEEFRQRFRQEVESARRVGGYWTAPVLDADTEAAVPWVATGYVAGPSLQQVVGHDHGALPERSVRTLAAGLAHALQDIHAAGIVHRDLKPSNVLVTIDGPRVIDFGIARALETVTDGGLTRTGALVGSPGFMAPEQVRGDRITPACDVFCLGSVLAYAATGALPFGTANSGVHALMFRIAQEEPDLEGVPEGIADLVRDCLRKDPAARPSLAAVLERTGAQDTVAEGRSRDPWLPSALVAQLGRHAVRLLDTENPETPPGASGSSAPGAPAPGPSPVPGASAAGGSAAADSAPAGSAAAGAAPPGSGPAGSAPADSAAAGAAAAGSGAAGSAHPGQTPGSPNPGEPEAGAPNPGDPNAGAAGTAGPPPPRQPGSGTPANNHLPTLVVGGPGAPTPPPAYGHPQQHPSPPPAHGYAPAPAWIQAPGAQGAPPPQYHPHPYGGLGSTPPYGPPPYGPPQEPPRRGRSTALLVVVALVVALGAGGSVYALMSGGKDDDGKAGGDPTTSTSAPGTTGGDTAGPAPTDGTSSTPETPDGTIPAGYLGTWTTTIDNASGVHTRRLTIQQGEVGDTVMSLVAEGPAGNSSYRCVFEADLTADPGTDGPLRLGPSTVTTGPASSCTPGEPTDVTLLPNNTLTRTNTATGETLTYTHQ
ncbi:serine/threonine-protein kinase [Streptomyces sp. SID5910]|uniref:serine/threonine-protein kinase n=1 Tax=Streptomyces sp. SID5910 TaxID=2690312 RepID=UPI00136CCA73|nr:serine/threonine-protein kinase [Streptomyces sp. SID5910]MYR43279.1 protein kinase [Streptomyces sp. SID5910]